MMARLCARSINSFPDMVFIPTNTPGQERRHYNAHAGACLTYRFGGSSCTISHRSLQPAYRVRPIYKPKDPEDSSGKKQRQQQKPAWTRLWAEVVKGTNRHGV